MNTLYWILIFFGTYAFMEFMAWFTHKYIMHGFLWKLHKDHHQITGTTFQLNDLFFIIFALPSITLIILNMNVKKKICA